MLSFKRGLTLSCAAMLMLPLACGDSGGEEAGDGTGDTAGDIDDATTTAETSDTADTTGDGDGDTTGDGDGDTTGDGDGDTGNSECFDIGDEAMCDDHPDCQSVLGSRLKQNGPDAPCLEPQEFLGCIPMQGCGDAETWFCQGMNNVWMVPDTCGPEDAQECDPPADPVEACP